MDARPLTDRRSEDEDLLDRALAGDAAALASLLDRHTAAARAVAYRLLGARAELDDLLQETRLRAMRSLATFERRSAFGTWFCRIAANLAISELRRRRKDESLAEDPPGSGAEPSQHAQRREQRERLAAAVDRLPPAMREAFDLTYREGLSAPQIAGRIGVPEATVRTRIFHARRRLREALDDLVSG